MDNNKYMSWHEAWIHLLNGKRIKLPHWDGYWVWENNTIMIHCRNGNILDIRQTDNPAYTFSNIASKDWIIDEK